MEQKKFFYDNKEDFDTLVELYKKFKDEFHKKHEEMIKKYLTRICEKNGTKIGTGAKTGTKYEIDKWWVHKSCVLGIYIKDDAPRIGIECIFEGESYKHPLGLFHIYVATWGGFDIKPYEKKLREAFPDRDINEYKTAKNRAFLLVKALTPDDKDIIPTLENTYNKLKGIVG